MASKRTRPPIIAAAPMNLELMRAVRTAGIARGWPARIRLLLGLAGLRLVLGDLVAAVENRNIAKRVRSRRMAWIGQSACAEALTAGHGVGRQVDRPTRLPGLAGQIRHDLREQRIGDTERLGDRIVRAGHAGRKTG